MTAAAHPAIDLYGRHVSPAFVKLLGVLGYGRVFERAEGAYLWDHQGRRYLDALAGFGATPLGHSHPRLTERLRAFLASAPLHLAHTSVGIHEADLAARLAALAPGDLEVALLANSGAEGVEAGLKLARAATGRAGLVFCAGGYHGTTLGALSVMGTRRLRAPFEPLLPGCAEVPFGDLGALERALAAKPAAFLVEPIQGEAGVVFPPVGYLAEARRLCTRAGALLVLDEVQTGLGRTGAWFACEHERVVPDVLVLGKALGGGVTPVSAALTSARWARKAYGTPDRFDLQGSTYGGHALGCVAALETLAIIEEEGLAARARDLGQELEADLGRRLEGHPFVKGVRGRGLLVGLELGPTDLGLASKVVPGLVELVSKQVFGQWLALRLLEAGVVAQPASQQWDVLKLEPPLTITREQVQELSETIARVLNETRSLPRLLADVTARLGKQALGGWSFG